MLRGPSHKESKASGAAQICYTFETSSGIFGVIIRTETSGLIHVMTRCCQIARNILIAARTSGVAVAIGVTSLLLMACGSPDGSTGARPTTGESSSDVPGGRDSPENFPRSRFVPLDNPDVVPANTVTFLQPDDRVLGLTVNGESRAYPINMMTFHHVANDVVGGLPVLVTF